MQVLIVVTHLLGTGHLRRAMTLARAFGDAGHTVTVASGGTPVPGLQSDGVNLVQLPPIKSDGTAFTKLLTGEGNPADDDYIHSRQVALQELANTSLDVAITELYPFGRRVLAAEFQNLLQAVKAKRPDALIFSSIRDILAPPSKPEKAQKTDAVLEQFYSGVLVHSDPAATPLSSSWPVSSTLEEKLIYTGFVAPSAPEAHPEQAGAGEVLVSAGGGPVGVPVFRTAQRAASLTPDLTWRLLIGGKTPQPLIDELMSARRPNVIAEPARPDFREMLNHAACSVSLAGYNTAMDLLQTGVPSLLIPFDDGGEVEQSLRAQSLAQLPGFDVLRSADLNPEVMAQLVLQLSQESKRDSAGIHLNGAAETVRLVEERLAGMT